MKKCFEFIRNIENITIHNIAPGLEANTHSSLYSYVLSFSLHADTHVIYI